MFSNISLELLDYQVHSSNHYKFNQMNKLKYFLNQNIHMIWREINHASKCKTNLLVQIVNDVPIVMQMNLYPHNDYKTQVLIEPENYKLIEQFRGWIDSFPD